MFEFLNFQKDKPKIWKYLLWWEQVLRILRLLFYSFRDCRCHWCRRWFKKKSMYDEYCSPYCAMYERYCIMKRSEARNDARK